MFQGKGPARSRRPFLFLERCPTRRRFLRMELIPGIRCPSHNCFLWVGASAARIWSSTRQGSQQLTHCMVKKAHHSAKGLAVLKSFNASASWCSPHLWTWGRLARSNGQCLVSEGASYSKCGCRGRNSCCRKGCQQGQMASNRLGGSIPGFSLEPEKAGRGCAHGECRLP